MLARTKLVTSVAALATLLCLASPAAAASWSAEPVPAGPGALGPARLSFDSQGRGLLLWNGVATATQPRFTGMASRAPGGGWTRVANLPGVGYGNGQALQYGTTRVLFVSGQVASYGAYHRAKLRLVAAYGRSDGTGLGKWQTLAPYETGFVAAANRQGHAIVLFDTRGNGLLTVERPSGGKFGKAAKVSPPGAFTPAVAINARGDRIVAWLRAGRIEARVRATGHGWGSVLDIAKAPSAPNASLHAAVTPGGSFVLTWDAAEFREDRQARLLAGTAQRRPNHGWRVYPLENATVSAEGGVVAEDVRAFPLVTGGGAIAIAWTGAVNDSTRFGVKSARLTSKGLRPAQILSGDALSAAIGDAAVGPDGRAAIVWSQSDAQNHIFTYAALSSGPGAGFGPADLLTPAEAIGIPGPSVGFQTVTGQAVAMVPIIQGGSGGYVSAVQTP